MGAPLKNPPVYLTVAQVRFNPILKLPEFLPSIQDGMRRSGFAAYAPHKAIAFQLTMRDGQPTPVAVVGERFSFGNLEKTHSFMLDADALTLQSTDYGHFEAFSSVFMMGLALVHDIVGLDFTERIGLRYLDRVFPVGGDTLPQYLVPEALGLAGRLGGNVQQTYLEAIVEFGAYKLRSRVITQVGALAFPPDMLPGDLHVNKRLAAYAGLYAILDNDGFLETREGFSPSGVTKHLNAIHKIIGDAFRALATDHARTVWDRDQ